MFWSSYVPKITGYFKEASQRIVVSKLRSFGFFLKNVILCKEKARKHMLYIKYTINIKKHSFVFYLHYFSSITYENIPSTEVKAIIK